MAVLARGEITLVSVRDIKANYRYYLLQPSTLAKPSKPTSNPPSKEWDDVEPTYKDGSTSSLYFVDLTVYSDDTWAYSEVSLSSSYEAAKSAWNKANNAEGMANDANNKVDQSHNEIISKGEQLVINGNGYMKDNTNFSRLEFDGAQANNSPGSFTMTGKPERWVAPFSDNSFPISAELSYRFEHDFKTKSAKALMYSFLSFYDCDGNPITANTHMYHKGTLTSLKADLKNGDTKVCLDTLSGWRDSANSYDRTFIFWDYKNSGGYVYPPETYSRHDTPTLYTNYSQVDKNNNVITLDKPWSGGFIKKGTQLSQGSAGNNYKYAYVGIPGTSWEHHVYTYGGIDYSGLNIGNMFPPGTAFAKVGFLWNYEAADDQVWVTNISVKTDYQGSIDKVQDSADNANDTAHRAEDKIDDLSVGGVNLLLDSRDEVKADSYQVAVYRPSRIMSAGERVTISICVTPAKGVTHLAAYTSYGNLILGFLNLDGSETQVSSLTTTINFADGATPSDNIVNNYIRFYRFPNDGTVTGNTTIHWAKMELGNMATDWSPAPEDVNGKIETDINTKYDQITGETNSAIDNAVGNLADSTSRQYMDILNNIAKIEHDLGDVANFDKKYSERADAIEAQLNSYKAEVGQYMEFGTNGLHLGAKDSLFSTVIDNKGMYFKQGSDTAAYINNSQLYIPDAVIENSLILGDFFFAPHADRSFSLIWQDGLSTHENNSVTAEVI